MASEQELKEELQNALWEKVLYRSAIKGYEQRLSAAQKKLSQPSLLSETRKFGLELEVKNSKRLIKKDKKSLLANEKAIKKLQDALGQLTSASEKPDSSLQKETQKPTSSDLRLNDATREKIFNQSMTWGHIETIIIKVLIVGAAGVGKSSFLSRLLGVAISLIRNSTGVVEKAQRVNCQRLGTTDLKNNIVWEVVGPKKLTKLLADAITSGIEKFTASVSPPHASRRSNNGSGSHSTSSADASYSTARTTVLQLIGRSKEGKLLKMTWIYLIDSGGQPQFHELLTAFIRNTTLGIFVFRLSDRLDDKPRIEYYKGGKPLGEPYPFPMSHKEIFQHCVQTISSLPSTSPLKDQAPTRPKILLLGTHRDEENKCSETRDEKEKILRDILHKGPNPDSAISEDLLYYGNKCIFPLNAKSPEKQDEEIIGDIREEIVRLAPQPQSIPLQYYALELELEKKEESVISFKECLDIAKHSLLFKETAARAAIHHLDSLNLIQYFPECAEEVIFCDPNILLNKVNELIEKSYSLRGLTPSKPKALRTGDWVEFHMRGRVTLPMLKEFPEGFVQNLYDHHTLAKIFEDLLILTRFEQDDSFFMPALLDVKDLKFIQRPTKTCLIIAFSSGYAPLGLFSSSIAFLTSSNNRWPSPWMFLFEKGQLFRNVVSFDVESVVATLIDRSTHFEVHVELQEGMQEDPSMILEVCRIIRQGIKEAIKQSMKKRHICSASYSESFFCPCDSYATYHLASVKEVFGKYRRCCEVHTGKGGALEEHHYQWLGIEPSTPSKAAPNSLGSADHFKITPFLENLNNEELIKLGSALGLSFGKLKRMTMLLGDVIQAWLNVDDAVITRSGPPSWTSLATALERTGHTAIASKVRKEKLGQVLTTPSPPRPTPAGPSVNPLPDEVDSTLKRSPDNSHERSHQTPSTSQRPHHKSQSTNSEGLGESGPQPATSISPLQEPAHSKSTSSEGLRERHASGPQPATTQSTSTHPLLQSTTRIAQPATQTSNRGWFWWTVFAFSLLAVIFALSYTVPSSKEQTSVDLGRIDTTTRLDKPELSSLEHLKGPHSDVRIIRDSGEYRKLGICLLKLPNTAELEDMERDCSGKTYCIKLAIFNKWLQGQGEKPVTWTTLIYVLEECMQLVELAKDIKLIIASADETLARASSTVIPR